MRKVYIKYIFVPWSQDITTKTELDKRIKMFKRANPDSSIDSGVYDDRGTGPGYMVEDGLINVLDGKKFIIRNKRAY